MAKLHNKANIVRYLGLIPKVARRAITPVQQFYRYLFGHMRDGNANALDRHLQDVMNEEEEIPALDEVWEVREDETVAELPSGSTLLIKAKAESIGPSFSFDQVTIGGIKIGRRITQYAVECRNHYGFKEDNEHNRTLAHHHISRHMKKNGMRSSHVAAQLPIAVQLSLQPTKYDIMAKRLRNSAPAVRRREEFGRRVKRFYRKPNDWIPWFHVVDPGDPP